MFVQRNSALSEAPELALQCGCLTQFALILVTVHFRTPRVAQTVRPLMTERLGNYEFDWMWRKGAVV